MAEEIIIHQGGKSEKYETLLPQMRSLLSGECDRVANMANFVAALQTTFGFFWVGFYVVREEELVLAPFQGPIALKKISRKEIKKIRNEEKKERMIKQR